MQTPAIDATVLQEAGARALDVAVNLAAVDDANWVVSPVSVLQAFSLLSAGARGATLTELEQALALFPASTQHEVMNAWLLGLRDRALPAIEADPAAGVGAEDAVVVDVVNQLFVDTSFEPLPSFLDVASAHYDASVQRLGFRVDPEPARLAINSWVEERTRERIVDLLPERSITSATRMVLANALYLKAPWVEAFDVARTADQTFFAATGPQTVPFLHGEMSGGHGVAGGATVVRLPLRGGSLSFVIALPAEGTDNSDVDLTAVWEALPGLSSESLALSLPKLAVTRSTNLKQSLERLGVGALFDGGQCDLSGLNDIEQLFVSGAFHKAFVGVDEKGIEAAAATAIVVSDAEAPPPPIAVVVDRPFQFLIVDTALSLPLFVGAVTSID